MKQQNDIIDTKTLSPFDDKKIKTSSNKHEQFTVESISSEASSSSSLTPPFSSQPEEEKKIVRALDLRMMPLFCIFYFADFLDRANIGNAALAGIQNDLHMSSNELSFAISAFYITYILFEIPSNCILKRTRASIYLSSIMLAWGLVTIVLAFVTNFLGLLICRLLLGVAQSGYIPAILYQLSLVYKPTENTMRVAFLLTMASMSGIVSGPLAYASALLEGQIGLHGWQYLFLFEGVPTVLLSILSYILLFDDIQNVKWLTPAQKQIQRLRMAESSSEDQDGDDDHSGTVTLQTFAHTFTDWKVYMFALVYFCQAVCVTSVSIFLPTIIAGFGYPKLTSQLMTAPPCLAGSIFVLLGGYLTDRYDRRTPIILLGFCTMVIGYVLLLILQDAWALYACLFVLTSGMGMASAPTVGWSSVNFPDITIRVLAVAAVVMFGNSGSVVASFLYPSTDAPHHCCAMLGALASGMTGYFLRRKNQRRDHLVQKQPNDHDEKKQVDQQQLQYQYHY